MVTPEETLLKKALSIYQTTVDCAGNMQWMRDTSPTPSLHITTRE